MAENTILYPSLEQTSELTDSIIRQLLKRMYVQDGLIAWWDGEWNAGLGIHDENATVWKDLAGNRDLTVSSHGSFSDSYFQTDGQGAAATYPEALAHSNTNWLEIVFAENVVGNNNNPVVLFLSKNSNGILSLGCCFRNTNMYGSRQAGLNILNKSIRSYSGRCNNELAQRLWYCDGKQYTNSFGTAEIYGDGTISVGALSDGTRPKATKIHCIRVYNRLLSAAEVVANYATDKQRFNLP